MEQNITRFIEQLGRVDAERLQHPGKTKQEINNIIEKKSKRVGVYYKMIAEETLLSKGGELLDVLRTYPDDLLRIDPYPGYIGYRTSDGKRYSSSFELLTAKGSTWFDEWGVTWQHTGTSVGSAAIDHPLRDWNDYERYMRTIKPLGSLPERLENAKKLMDGLEHRNATYCAGKLTLGLFERAHLIRGMENLLLDLYINKGMVHRLLREITNFILAQIEEWAKLEADGFFMTDDWGDQRDLLISPDTWKTFFKPYYREIFDCAHRHGMHLFFHSCGAVMKIVGELLDAGMDVLHPVQPSSNDYAQLAKEYADHLVVMGGLDVQKLPMYTHRDEIEKVLTQFVDIFQSHNCGVFLAPTNTIVPDTPLENIRYAFEIMHALGEKG